MNLKERKLIRNIKIQILVSLGFVLSVSAVAQNDQQFSVHRHHSELFGRNIEIVDTHTNDKLHSNSKSCTLESYVFGWHPYWSNDLETNYRWDLLSDISFFSYEVDPMTGDPINIYNWETANVVDMALANGVRVNLCVTLFEEHDAFFANSAAQQNLIDSLLTLVQNRNAHGVNIDFELVPGDQAEYFNQFLVNLADQFHSEIPGSQVSIALHAVDWNGIYNIPLLKDHVDLFIIMAYDYYWPGSSLAGPTGQLYMMNTFNRTIARSIVDYLDAGVPKEKLLCGLPYYGYEWTTESDEVPTSTTASGEARTIKTVKNNSNGYYSQRNFHLQSMCSYYNYFSEGIWHQLWIDEEESMKYKYDIVKQFGIAGIGIWALGYDNGYQQMWDLLESTFTDCAETPCNYRVYDTGGPYRSHFDNEDYTFTIAPDSYADYLALNFEDFELEANFDSLWIYDGSDTNAPLIGGYSGTTSPGYVVASGNALTLRFISDGATVREGWNAEWMCSPLSVEDKTRHFRLFPNPTKDILFIELNRLVKAEIYNVSGQLLKMVFSAEIDVSDYPTGLYIIKAYTKGSSETQKMIISR
jgi:spore germination protein YaaH